MSYQKMFVFEPEDLVRLMTHYWDGLVPLDSEVKEVKVHPALSRMVGLEVLSKEWDSAKPLQLTYEGKKVLGWSKDHAEKLEWNPQAETPRRQ